MKRWIALTALLSLLLAGCSKTEIPPQTEPKETQTTQQTEPAPVSVQIDTAAAFTDRDREGTYSEEKSARILLEGNCATCSSNAVRIDGGKITILDEGTYILSGILNQGCVTVAADKTDKTQLVLMGAQITNPTGAAVCIEQADKVFITLAQGTENRLHNGGSFEDHREGNVDATIFSREDVTFNGTGRLEIISPAGHGIVSKDQLTVAGGSYEIEAAFHGLEGKDCVCITGADLQITAGKDGIHAENNDEAASGYVYVERGTFTLDVQGDGISAASSMQIDDGTFQITTGGGSKNGNKQTSDGWGGFPGEFPGGMGGGRPGKGNRPAADPAAATSTQDSTSIKGIKAGGDLAIRGGTFTLNCADDGVHSNSNVSIDGGNFTIATGDDGFHADETLKVAAGAVNITESYEGLEGLHVQVAGGNISLVATDDGINAAGGKDQSGFGGNRGDRFGGGRPGGMGGGNGSILISGGTLYLQASGDGIDANGTLEITGGDTVVCGPTQGDTATLDYDKSAVITGGTFIGTGARGMAQSFSGGSQGIVALQAGNISAGTKLTLADSSGKLLLEQTPALSYAVVILSCPEMIKGESYTVTIGDQMNQFQAS